MLAAMSRASTSGVRRQKAFFLPSGLHRSVNKKVPFNGCNLPIIPDKGVDLDAVDVVELLQAGLDLGLVGLDVDDEDKGVVLLHLLHGALGVERLNDDAVGIVAGEVRDRVAGVLGGALVDQGLGAVEGGRVADLQLLAGVDLEEGCQPKKNQFE